MGGTTLTPLPNFHHFHNFNLSHLDKHQLNMTSFAWFVTMPNKKCTKKISASGCAAPYLKHLPTYVPSYLKCPANLEFLKTPSWWHIWKQGDVVPFINCCNCTEKSGTCEVAMKKGDDSIAGIIEKKLQMWSLLIKFGHEPAFQTVVL